MQFHKLNSTPTLFMPWCYSACSLTTDLMSQRTTDSLVRIKMLPVCAIPMIPLGLSTAPSKSSAYWQPAFKYGLLTREDLPYIPRVHLSEGSLVRSPLRWLCSEEPMVRRSFIPKFLYSESCYVPKSPYSERPPTIWILCYEGSLVRSSSSPKVLCSELPYSENRPSPIRVLYYEGPFVRSPSSSKIAMFRRFYLPNVARSIRIVCCEGSLFWKL